MVVAQPSRSGNELASRARDVCCAGFAGFAVWAIVHRV